MKKLILLGFAFCFCGVLLSQEWDWIHHIGGPSVDKVTGVARDQSGNIFLTGYFDSTLAFDSTHLVSAGGTDVFIAKYDADGFLIWAKQVGGQNDDYSSGISTDLAGNCYVTGFFFIQGNISTFGTTTISESADADIFIAKFSASGNILWVRNAGGRGDDASNAITTDISGNCYITGSFSGTASFSNSKITSMGHSDIFIAKYDAAGNMIWVRDAGGAYQDEAYGIATDPAGSCYITGYFTGNASFSTETTISSSGYFDTDVFYAKYNASGGLVFAKKTGGMGNDFGYGINVATNGQIYLCGIFKGTKVFGETTLTQLNSSNGFVSKIESSGKVLWVKGTDGQNTNSYHKLATDAAGNAYVIGSYSGDVQIGSMQLAVSGMKDICIVKYDSKGAIQWAIKGGGEQQDEGMAIAADPSGHCFVVGLFSEDSNFGKAHLTSKGLQDIFISRIK